MHVSWGSSIIWVGAAERRNSTLQRREDKCEQHQQAMGVLTPERHQSNLSLFCSVLIPTYAGVQLCRGQRVLLRKSANSPTSYQHYINLK